MDDDASPLPAESSLGRALSDSAVDFDLMDELLSGDCCWLEPPNYSDFFQQSTSASTSPFSSSPFFPLLDLTTTTTTTSNNNNNGSNENHETEETPIEETSEAADWLIQPKTQLVPVKERLIHALKFIKDSQRGRDVLVQIWVPVDRGGRNFLSTCDQPFWLDSSSQSLVSYRSVSTAYQFSAEENSNEILGLPGRVFIGRVPEWTPDVRYFSREEYPRVVDAQRYNVSGTIALPVFERGSRSCIGVVEVVSTTQKINYSSELESICTALQAVDLRSSDVLNIPRVKAVDLRSSDVLNIPRVKVSSNSYQAALPEIREVLEAVCETHSLPLAQTWIPCVQQGKRGSRHSDENYKECVSTVDAACYVNDPAMLPFHEACSEHHLFRGQGVAGKAFTTNQPCFSPDITSFFKTEYPLSHHAKLFRLRAAVAIRLRSIHTGKADFVLEFFLPVNCTGSEEQKQMLNSLSITIQQVCRSLRVVTAKELEDDDMLEVDESYPSDLLFDESVLESDQRPGNMNVLSSCSPSVGISREMPSWIASTMEVQDKEGRTAHPFSLPLDFSNQENEEFRVATNWDTSEAGLPNERIFSDLKQNQQSTTNQKDSSPSDRSSPRSGKTTEKRRAKSEKTVSLQVLRQYFAGSLKDAAKSIGVCPTTLKRICRQHGITRWPSRKIKKVGHSLKKLQVVIDSVQGAEGTFQFSSVYENFTKASSPNKKFSGNQTGHPESSNTPLQQEGRFSSHASASTSLSSSSCTQSSSSSLGCSSGSKQYIQAPQLVIKQEASVEENQVAMLKREKSAVELHLSNRETTETLVRSQSHNAISEHLSIENPSQLQKKRTDVFKVKAVYGEDKVRFRLQPTWGFQALKQETMKRFNISDTSSVDLKYLDDDCEWVLLTCDEDLQECIDVYKTSRGDTIKVAVHHAAPGTRASFSFPALS